MTEVGVYTWNRVEEVDSNRNQGYKTMSNMGVAKSHVAQLTLSANGKSLNLPTIQKKICDSLGV